MVFPFSTRITSKLLVSESNTHIFTLNVTFKFYREHENIPFLFYLGIACNSLLAKICGDLNKPNGQYFLPPTIEDVKEFMVKLPIRKVNGIGNITQQLLNSLSIFTCGDLWNHRGVINLLFKPATVSFLLGVSLGIGSSWFLASDTVESQKSISSERTFSSSNSNIEPKLCHSLCLDLERELISKKLKAQIVTLKIKTVDFQVKTRAVRLVCATNEADIIFETAWNIYKSFTKDIKDLAIRLLGVRLSNFHSNNEQVDDNLINSLPLCKSKKQGRIDHLLSKLKTREVPDKSIPKFECPICCTKFLLYSELEVHVEKCFPNTSDTSTETETKSSFSNASSSSSTYCEQMSENIACGSLTERRQLTKGDFSDQSSNLNNNKRKSPISNQSNSKKRHKKTTTENNRKITDFIHTTFENSAMQD